MKRRWCILFRDRLEIHKKQESFEILDVIPLCSVVGILADIERFTFSHGFQLETPGRIFIFQAPLEAAQKHWLTAIAATKLLEEKLAKEAERKKLIPPPTKQVSSRRSSLQIKTQVAQKQIHEVNTVATSTINPKATMDALSELGTLLSKSHKLATTDNKINHRKSIKEKNEPVSTSFNATSTRNGIDLVKLLHHLEGLKSIVTSSQPTSVNSEESSNTNGTMINLEAIANENMNPLLDTQNSKIDTESTSPKKAAIVGETQAMTTQIPSKFLLEYAKLWVNAVRSSSAATFGLTTLSNDLLPLSSNSRLGPALRDGTILFVIASAELVASGESALSGIIVKPRARTACLTNITKALSIFHRLKIRKSRIPSAEDIVDGREEKFTPFLLELFEQLALRRVCRKEIVVPALQWLAKILSRFGPTPTPIREALKKIRESNVNEKTMNAQFYSGFWHMVRDGTIFAKLAYYFYDVPLNNAFLQPRTSSDRNATWKVGLNLFTPKGTIPLLFPWEKMILQKDSLEISPQDDVSAFLQLVACYEGLNKLPCRLAEVGSYDDPLTAHEELVAGLHIRGFSHGIALVPMRCLKIYDVSTLDGATTIRSPGSTVDRAKVVVGHNFADKDGWSTDFIGAGITSSSPRKEEVKEESGGSPFYNSYSLKYEETTVAEALDMDEHSVDAFEEKEVQSIDFENMKEMPSLNNTDDARSVEVKQDNHFQANAQTSLPLASEVGTVDIVASDEQTGKTIVSGNTTLDNFVFEQSKELPPPENNIVTPEKDIVAYAMSSSVPFLDKMTEVPSKEKIENYLEKKEEVPKTEILLSTRRGSHDERDPEAHASSTTSSIGTTSSFNTTSPSGTISSSFSTTTSSSSCSTNI
jgi:PH domain/Calponin homology (CH) domain